MKTQRQSSLHQTTSSKENFVVCCFIVAVALIICATIVWIIDQLKIIPGPWTSIFGAVFTSKQQSSLHQGSLPKKKFITCCFIIAAMFIICGTTIWVLNILGIILGPWTGIFGAIFTGIGMLIALLNCLLILISIQGKQ